MIEADLALIDNYDEQIAKLELHLIRTAKVDDPVTFGFLRTIPGIGPILGLILLYEIDQITRFPEVGNFLSYSRLVRCEHSSAGKVKGSGGKKIGNAHLKWGFGELATTFLRANPEHSSCTSGSRKSTARARPFRCSPPSSHGPPTTCSAEERSSTRTSSIRIESEAAV
jgi:transposase